MTLVAEDVRKNDERMLEKSGVKSQLSRMDGALKTVHLLLGTPLMQEVAKVPMLKPPVKETNVLKMDKNFKGALRLYYFLVSYQKDGLPSGRPRAVSVRSPMAPPMNFRRRRSL